MLQFGKERARRLIAGGAWAWRMYVADYRTKPIVQTQLAGFASNHGQPEERFYNLMCLAFGADPVTFADLTEDGYLPPNRCQAASVVARGTRTAAGKGLAHRRVGPAPCAGIGEGTGQRHPGQRDCDKNDRSHDCLLGKRTSPSAAEHYKARRGRHPETIAASGSGLSLEGSRPRARARPARVAMLRIPIGARTRSTRRWSLRHQAQGGRWRVHCADARQRRSHCSSGGPMVVSMQAR